MQSKHSSNQKPTNQSKYENRHKSLDFSVIWAARATVINDKQYQIRGLPSEMHLLKDWIIALLLVIMLYNVHRNRITLFGSLEMEMIATQWYMYIGCIFTVCIHDLWSVFGWPKNFIMYLSIWQRAQLKMCTCISLHFSP